MAGCRAFRADGDRGCSFDPGGAVIPTAGAYWAPITTFVITQSSLGAALTVSWQRFVGTALGALLGAIVGSHFEPNIFVFGTSVFILGLR